MTRRQRALPFALAPPRASRRPVADRLDAQNRACAAIILADAEKHGGAGSLPVEWAKQVMQRGVRA